MAAVPLAARRSRGPHHPRCERDVCSVEGFALFLFPVGALVGARNACLRTAHMVHHRQASFG